MLNSTRIDPRHKEENPKSKDGAERRNYTLSVHSVRQNFNKPPLQDKRSCAVSIVMMEKRILALVVGLAILVLVGVGAYALFKSPAPEAGEQVE